VKKIAADVWSSIGVLSGIANGTAVINRKNGDQAIGNTSLGAMGLRVWRTQPFGD